MEYTYLQIELAIDRDIEGPEFSRVMNRLKDTNRQHIGKTNDNHILNTRIYEVEYQDGCKVSIATNQITMGMFVQVDNEGNRHVLFDFIVDSQTYGKDVKTKDYFIKSNNEGHRSLYMTKGWETLTKWKDGNSSWEAMKDVK